MTRPDQVEHGEHRPEPDLPGPDFLARAREIALEALESNHRAWEIEGATAFRAPLNPSSLRQW